MESNFDYNAFDKIQNSLQCYKVIFIILFVFLLRTVLRILRIGIHLS